MTETLKTHKEWMSVALAEARKSERDVPVGTALVVGGKLICATHNRKEELNDPTAHAEILAIRQAALLGGSWRLTGATLYTTLEPCPMCAEAILQARVGCLVFGAYDTLSGAVGSAFNLYAGKRIYPIPEVLGGIMEEPCAQILKDFFESRKHKG
jgi:tRNA(adenine34) deaminase